MNDASTPIADQRRPRWAGMERVALLFFTGVWVILQNNARISDNVPDDAYLSLLHIPRASRVIEAVLLIGLFLASQPRLVRARLGDFSVLVSMFLLGALVSIELTPTWLESQLQGTYVYAAPLLLFGWAVSVRPTRPLVNRLIGIFSVYLGISIAVALLVQYPVLRTKSDYIHGLFSDAHAFGSVLAIVSCVAFSRFLAVGGVRLLLLSVALFLVSYYPANEKMIAFNLAWWAGALAWRLVKHPRSRRGLVIGSAACAAVLWVAVARADYVGEWFRVSDVTSRSMFELGPFQAWARAGYVVADSPSALIAGIGPGNFAGVAAARALEDDPVRYRALSERAASTLRDAEKDVTALGWVANTWSNLLAEFGVLGFLLFAFALKRFSWPILRWRPATRYDAVVRTVFLAGFGSTIYQGFITPYTNWSEPVLVYPVMVVAAYCYNAAADSDHGT
jgi:hypothetical protein